MQKYIILSFDDGYKDNYNYAYKLMLKYGVKASMHICTGYIAENNQNYLSFDEIKEMSNNGFDFSSHGHRHINEKNDLAESLACLKYWRLLDEETVIFSSPKSEIFEKNIIQYKEMLNSNNVKYVRTGTQIKRNGFLYIILYCLQEISGSKYLFYLLNKNNINKLNIKKYFIKSIAVKFKNTVKQLEYLIDKMNEGDVACFLFHSIIPQNEIKNINDWTFSLEKFESFLRHITNRKDLEILTIKEYIKREQ